MCKNRRKTANRTEIDLKSTWIFCDPEDHNLQKTEGKLQIEPNIDLKMSDPDFRTEIYNRNLDLKSPPEIST